MKNLIKDFMEKENLHENEYFYVAYWNKYFYFQKVEDLYILYETQPAQEASQVRLARLLSDDERIVVRKVSWDNVPRFGTIYYTIYTYRDDFHHSTKHSRIQEQKWVDSSFDLFNYENGNYFLSIADAQRNLTNFLEDVISLEKKLEEDRQDSDIFLKNLKYELSKH